MAAPKQTFHGGVRPLRVQQARARLLWLRRNGWCGCGEPLASKCSCLGCLVKHREESRRRRKAQRIKDCLSRRLQAALKIKELE